LLKHKQIAEPQQGIGEMAGNVLRINICGEKPTLRKSAKRYQPFHRQSRLYSRQHPSHLLKILKLPFQKSFNPLDSLPQIRSRPFSFIGFPDLIVVEQHLAFPGKQPIGVVGVMRGF
jgi:hypothetical protein